MLTPLDRVVPSEPGRPDVGGPDHPMRLATIDLAAGRGWDAERAGQVVALFDGMAPAWSARVAGEADPSVGDALRRGGLPRGGRCLEIGSGTGDVTPLLAEAFDMVASLDLSGEMLRHAPVAPGHRVRADAARLPLPPASVDVVAMINAFLFPTEVDRVLRPDGFVLWVSTLGDRTPIYLPPAAVLDHLPGDWDGVTALAGWGEWLVAHRA